MAYLNDVKIVANLAIKPELSFSRKGRRYCNFVLRTIYRDESNEMLTDYINVTCFDDDAEILVRDADIGDTILCSAYIAQQHWWVNDAHLSKIVLIGNSTQIISKGNGQMPQIAEYDKQNADDVPYNYEAGQKDLIHSYSIPWLKECGIHSESAHAPQPMKDGKWTMPTGRVNEAVGRFITDNERVMNNMEDPIQPGNDADLNWAKKIIPEDLPVVFNKHGTRIVTLPYGKVITEENYFNLLKVQSEALSQMPEEQRNRILEIAKSKFGIELEMCGLPNHLKSRSKNFAFRNNVKVNFNDGIDDCKKENGNYSLFGFNKDDWTKNEKGEWVLKRKENAIDNDSQ